MPDYKIHLDVLHGHHERIDIPSIVAACGDPWWNQTLTQDDDEFFLVLEGKLFIDLEEQTLELGPMQGATISKGVMHRPRAPQKTVMLMVESSAIVPTGD
jgi:mannose-6-phosphate isomerase-like protein (cupin superfamily)